MSNMSKRDGIYLPPEAHQDMVARMMAAANSCQAAPVLGSRYPLRSLQIWALSVAASLVLGIFIFSDAPGTKDEVWVTEDLAWEVFQAGELELSVEEAGSLLDEDELDQLLAELNL